MGTTTQKLAKVIETKENIRAAIIAQGVAVPANTTFATYPSKILAISTGVTPSGRIGLYNTVDQDVTNYATAYIDTANITGLNASNIVSGTTILGVVGEAPNPSGTLVMTNKTADVTAYASATAQDGSVTLSGNDINIIQNPTINSSTGKITISGSGSTTVTGSVSPGWITTVNGKQITATVTGELQLTTKGAETITPGTSNKTIVAGTYLTGTQTIQGDANLIRANIISGKTIFGVAGSAVVPSGDIALNATATSANNISVTNYTTASITGLDAANIRTGITYFGTQGSLIVQKYYEGSSAPASSLGVDGDIYLQH